MSSLQDCWTLLYHVVVTLVAYFIAKFVYDLMTARKQRPKPPVLKTDWKKDIVYLYQFPRTKGTANLSPFCLKVEMFLRIHDIKHEIIDTISGRSAEGKLPFIEFNGEHIVDSQLIIETLKKHFNIKEGKTAEDRGLIRLITRMFDHATFYNLIYHKAGTDTLTFTGVMLEGKAPSFVKYLLAPLFAHKIWNVLNSQGTGKHTEQEVINILRWDLEGLDAILGDKKYLVGDKLTLADCTFFSHVQSTYNLSFEQPIQQLLDEEFPRLKALHDRIAKEAFPDIKFGRVK